MLPKPPEGDFLLAPLFVRLLTLQGDSLFGGLFSLEQKEAPPPPRASTVLGAAILNMQPCALDGAISSLHAWQEEKEQCLLFFVESFIWLQRRQCHKAGREISAF